MIENLFPAPDDFAFAVEHCDIEGDARSIEHLRGRLPRSPGDEFANRDAALFRLPCCLCMGSHVRRDGLRG